LVAWANSGAADSTLDIQGGRFSQSALAEQYLRKSRGTRIAFVTDTRWNDISRPGLLRLASGAQRLYCDAFYAEAQARQAEKYGHMTAPQTADFALQADAAELVLMHFSGRYAGNYQSIIDEARAVFPRTSGEFV
jgi:ribonuclease Z